jgi:hypothetical protein
MFNGGFKPTTTVKGLDKSTGRFPRLGKIKLGIKAKTKKGKEYPKEVNYFVCPDNVIQVIGEDEPKELDIMVPSDDLSKILPVAYKMYGSGYGVKCIGDGETGVEKTDGGFDQTRACTCENYEQGKCKLVAHFLFLIPKVSLGGVFQIDTSSINSIIDIRSGLEFTAEMVEKITGKKRFSMIPLKLVRNPKETHGSGMPEMHYTMSVQPAFDLTQLAGFLGSPVNMLGIEMPTPQLIPENTVSYSDMEDDKNDDESVVKKEDIIDAEPVEDQKTVENKNNSGLNQKHIKYKPEYIKAFLDQDLGMLRKKEPKRLKDYFKNGIKILDRTQIVNFQKAVENQFPDGFDNVTDEQLSIIGVANVFNFCVILKTFLKTQEELVQEDQDGATGEK